MNQPDIVLVHYSTAPGGIEVILPQIIERLPQYSYSAFVIRPSHPGISVYKKDLPVSLHYGSFNSIIAGIKLFIYACKKRDSVFHVFNIGPFFLLMLRLAGARCLIYSIHGTQYWKNGIERCVFRFLWRVSMSGDYIITANSKFSRSVFNDKVLSSREISLLYNPIDYERFKPMEGKIRSKYPHRIIYCGRLDKEKNLDEWIRIANLVLQRMPDILFELYGEGSQLPHLQDLINKYNLGGRIILKGFTSEPEKAMREADLLMFLSGYESFGNVVVES
ncbi:MAG: glycosyltransferase, partial [Bacteroidales bacterium]